MTEQAMDPEVIKEAVRDYYGRAARSNPAESTTTLSRSGCCSTSASDCCGNQASLGAGLYTGDELAQVPVEAATHSHGCGNPIAHASLRTGEVVLDLGSGGGLDVLLAARRVGPEGFVYGLDMTDEMLDLARRNAAKAGTTNVGFLKGDLEAIPLPDASVDVIISNCVINLTPDKGQALREAWRVLRPGGRLAVSDVVIEGGLEGLPVSEQQIRNALSWAGCIAGALTKTQYEAFLADAGFEAISVEAHHRYAFEDLLPDMQVGLASLAPKAMRDLVSRFTSSYITARRPASGDAAVRPPHQG